LSITIRESYDQASATSNEHRKFSAARLAKNPNYAQNPSLVAAGKLL
jgi:hypothetical protein